MSTVLSLLLIVAAFAFGVWYGAHAAHIAGPAPVRDADVTPTVPTK